jgi:hypothetical protein
MRRCATLLAVGCLALAACGGGSSGDSSGATPKDTFLPGRTTPTRTARTGGPPGTPTATPLPGEGQTLYVRSGGNDANPGTAPEAALKTLAAAAKLLRPGATVYVGSGRYQGRVEITGVAGTETSPVRLIADTAGTHTHDRPGPVSIDAAGDTVALILTKSPYVSVEGFLITGAAPKETPRVSATAVQIRSNSHHATMRDSIIANGTEADGVRVTASSDALIFDNIIFSNDRGVVVSGDAPRTRIINNTIVEHLRTGIVLTQSNGVAPSDTTVTNNIIQGSENNIAISVNEGPPSALDGYDGNHNLVFEPGVEDQTSIYRPAEIRGGQGDVRLAAGSPAINKGSNDIGADLLNALFKRSATVDGTADKTPVDLGYHYPR